MKLINNTWVTIALTVMLAGCDLEPYPEPTVDKFNGRITHNGEPVSFAADERVILQLVFHKNGERFGIPITSEGTFDIGWMPIGEYSATLEKSGGGGRGGPVGTFSIPGGLTIEEGETEYVVELGEKHKP